MITMSDDVLTRSVSRTSADADMIKYVSHRYTRQALETLKYNIRIIAYPWSVLAMESYIVSVDINQ